MVLCPAEGRFLSLSPWNLPWLKQTLIKTAGTHFVFLCSQSAGGIAEILLGIGTRHPLGVWLVVHDAEEEEGGSF